VTSGDRALGFRLEPRFQLPLRGSIGAQLFAFHDSVRVWNLDPFTTEDGRTLNSWGGGARFSLGGRFGLEAIYARPTDRGQSTDPRRAPDRLLISLTAQLSPAVRQGVM
jgi:hemolysin activation/secretion protein